QACGLALARQMPERDQRIGVLLLKCYAVRFDPCLRLCPRIGSRRVLAHVGCGNRWRSHRERPLVRDTGTPRSRGAYLNDVLARPLRLEIVGRTIGLLGGLSVDFPQEGQPLSLDTLDGGVEAHAGTGGPLDGLARWFETREAQWRGLDV